MLFLFFHIRKLRLHSKLRRLYPICSHFHLDREHRLPASMVWMVTPENRMNMVLIARHPLLFLDINRSHPFPQICNSNLFSNHSRMGTKNHPYRYRTCTYSRLYIQSLRDYVFMQLHSLTRMTWHSLETALLQATYWCCFYYSCIYLNLVDLSSFNCV